jgi:hypothetical protein
MQLRRRLDSSLSSRKRRNEQSGKSRLRNQQRHHPSPISLLTSNTCPCPSPPPSLPSTGWRPRPNRLCPLYPARVVRCRLLRLRIQVYLSLRHSAFRTGSRSLRPSALPLLPALPILPPLVRINRRRLKELHRFSTFPVMAPHPPSAFKGLGHLDRWRVRALCRCRRSPETR